VIAMQVKRALLSVSDKSGLVDLGKRLDARGVELISTGGTARALREAGLEVKDVSDVTGFPEMLDGRVKTLHPMIHGGLLGRRDKGSHVEKMKEHGIVGIDLVVVNLYPFEEVLAKGADFPTLIENIDIGGPSMLRSAAKNHGDVAVVCEPADYETVAEQIESTGGVDDETRKRLALKVFARTAAYDAAISRGLAGEALPERYALSTGSGRELRYGENPHQSARVYPTDDALSLVKTAPLQGKALSYNNLLDADAAVFALRCLCDGDDRPGAIVIKHLTPCGAARAEDLHTAFKDALSGDPLSAFGGIVALNREVDSDTATSMAEIFLEVVVAPAFSEGAREVFAKKKNLRLLEIPNLVSAPIADHQIRSVAGGLLVQDNDTPYQGIKDAKVATKRAPTDAEWAALDVAFRICAPVKSNAITLVQGEKLIGAGGGQTSRVDAAKIAIEKAGVHKHSIQGAALGSDAFFPFADGVEVAAEAGVTCIAQPGGSKRDSEVIEACDKAGIAMVFTGERKFRH
jgi:phosphoribosylaminoimidazolecarboxamide formyltransferase/IMP cyclohydrolase